MGNALMVLFGLGIYGVLTLTLIGAWIQSEWLVFGVAALIALPMYGIPALLAVGVIAEYHRQADAPGDEPPGN